MADTAIEVKELTVKIDGQTILNRVSMSVPRGRHLAIIGPNGAGKTTLLKCLMRIIPSADGNVTVGGRPLGEYSQKELAKVMGYVPQADVRPLSFTVREFVAMGRYPYLNPFSKMSSADWAAIDEALQVTGVSDLQQRRIETLSGGERQCVIIAAAIAQGADILLLDEPTTFLDPKHAEEIQAILERLTRTLGLTIVAVTHDVNSAALWSDRIAALKDGRVVFQGSPKEMMCNEVLEPIYGKPFVFATHPQTGQRFMVPCRGQK